MESGVRLPWEGEAAETTCLRESGLRSGWGYWSGERSV